jgi:hypothetical protein
VVGVSETMEDPAMSDTTDTQTQQTDGGENESKAGRLPSLDTDATTNYLLWGALAAFSLFAVVAAAGLYTNVTNAIGIWVTHEYRPLVMAGFNLFVLLVAVLGVSVVLGRRT